MVKPRLFRTLDRHLAHMPSSSVLDIGFGDGTHALDMASRGHNVTAITLDQAEFDAAESAKRERNLGSGVCQFVIMDALDIMSSFGPSSFDAVIAHNVLHEVDKPDAVAIVESMQHVTRSLGVNAVGGYVMNPSELTNKESIRRMFRHGELARHYGAESGWDVIYLQEDPHTRVNSHNGKEFVSSHTDLIARKR